MIANLRQLDLNLLLVFDALMQERKLSRAAERLHLSQPAVSNALLRLRQQLGEPLFTRTSRGMTPTAHALLLYGPVRQALHLLQVGLWPRADFDLQAEHTFHLSMNDYAQVRLLPGLLERVRLLAPNVVLSVQSDEAGSIFERLASGVLDLAIDYLNFDSSELRYQALQEEQLVVIGRAGHPALVQGLTLAAYQDSQHISVPSRAGRGSPLEIVLGSAKVRRQVQLYVPHYLTIPALVANSDLLGTVPLRLAEMFSKVHSLLIAPLPMALPPIQISMIWHQHQNAVAGLQWLREQIRQISDVVTASCR